MKCINCGKEIPQGSKFCKYCGANQNGMDLNFKIKPLSDPALKIRLNQPQPKVKAVKPKTKPVHQEVSKKKRPNAKKLICFSIVPVLVFFFTSMFSPKVSGICIMLVSLVELILTIPILKSHKVWAILVILWILICAFLGLSIIVD